MAVKAGALRFNTDSNKLELYDGNQWTQIVATSPEAQTGGTRGVFGGYMSPTILNEINYINIDTTGNAIDFGNLTQARRGAGATASRTRGLFAGGATPTAESDTIDFITIASTGNSQDFGDLLGTKNLGSACSSPTRVVFAGGYDPANLNVMEYVQIPTTGNSIDFGDLSETRRSTASCSNGHGGL